MFLLFCQATKKNIDKDIDDAFHINVDIDHLLVGRKAPKVSNPVLALVVEQHCVLTG